MEVTKWLKPPVWRVKNYGDSASERRVSLENADAQADPTTLSEKADTTGGHEQRKTASRCTGVVATACTQGKRTQHGKPFGVVRDGTPLSAPKSSGNFLDR
jgi:hypothetical protein